MWLQKKNCLMSFHNIFDTDKKKALLALSITSLVWGASTPIMKWALLVTPVFVLAFLRFFVAALLLLFLRPNLHIQKKDIWKIILAALFGTSINISLLFIGLNLSTAINAAAIAAIVPLLTLLSSALFFNEKMTKNLLVGALLGLFGIFVILLEPIIDGGFSAGVLGNALLILAALSWVVYELLGKSLSKKYSSITIVFYTFLLGGLTFIPFAFNDLFTVIPKIYNLPQFYIGAGFGILLSSILAYIFWQWGLSKLTVSRAGFFLYLNPIVATIVAFFLLQEVITPTFVIGALLVFGGLYVGEGGLRYFPEFHLFSHLIINNKKGGINHETKEKPLEQ